MPTLDPRLAGLTNSGKARRVVNPRRSTRARSAVHSRLPDHDPVRNPQPVGPKQHLHDGLVHPDGGGQHAAADVGHAGQFQQALNRAVLAKRTVQHRKDDVESESGQCRGRFRASGAATIDQHERVVTRIRRKEHRATGAQARHVAAHLLDHFGGRRGGRWAIGEHPAAVLLDADRDGLIALPIDVREHRRRRRERHLVLARAAAVQDANTKSLHVCRRRKGTRRLEAGARAVIIG